MGKHCDSGNSHEVNTKIIPHQESWEHCLEPLKMNNIIKEMINISYIPTGIFSLTFLMRRN